MPPKSSQPTRKASAPAPAPNKKESGGLFGFLAFPHSSAEKGECRLPSSSRRDAAARNAAAAAKAKAQKEADKQAAARDAAAEAPQRQSVSAKSV